LTDTLICVFDKKAKEALRTDAYKMAEIYTNQLADHFGYKNGD